MKRNLFVRHVIQRENHLKNAIFDFFLSVASYPRLVLEVFIRKNFGEQYFSTSSVVSLGCILMLIPPIVYKLSTTFLLRMGVYQDALPGFWAKYASWYLFIVAFFYFSYKRAQEIKTEPSVFDFGKFSLYSGAIHPFFFTIKLFGKKATVRSIECFYEPAVFFILGLLLSLMGQPVGSLLSWCSIFYALSYKGAYKIGDDYVRKMINGIIYNEEMERMFVDGDDEERRGVRIRARRPNSREDREKVFDAFFEGADEEPTLVS